MRIIIYFFFYLAFYVSFGFGTVNQDSINLYYSIFDSFTNTFVLSLREMLESNEIKLTKNVVVTIVRNYFNTVFAKILSNTEREPECQIIFDYFLFLINSGFRLI